MLALFTILFFVAIIGLGVGLIKPELAMKWNKDETKRTRKNVLKYFGIASVVLFVLVGITPDGEYKSEKTDPVVADDVEEIEDTEEEEEVFWEITDANLTTLEKAYTDLDSVERTFVAHTELNFDDIEEGDRKDTVRTHLDRMAEERAEFQRVEQAEKDAKAEEERMAKEKQDEIDRLAKIEAEKEKYNTGITWKDMARDKDGRMGEFVKFKGKILQVMSGSGYMQYRMAVNSDYDAVILIEIQDELLDSNIIEDDIITIEGMSMGNTEYTTVMGAKKSIPAIVVDRFTR